MYRVHRYSVTLVREKSLLCGYKTISSPIHIYEIMKNLGELPSEQIHVMFLDTKNKIIGISQISMGTINACTISAREIFQAALLANATFIALVHNHPSGDPTPSDSDISITKVIDNAGKLMNIPLLDHVIIGNGEYISLKAKGII